MNVRVCVGSDMAKQRSAKSTGTPASINRDKSGVEVAEFGDDEGPTERAQHGTIEPIKPGRGGQAKKPARVSRTLDRLLNRRTISGQQFRAGEEFEETYFAARLDPSQIADLSRTPGQGRGDMAIHVYAARERIAVAIRLLGGWGTPPAATLVGVLGEGRTIKEHAQFYRLATRKPISRNDARAYLVAGLCVLAENW